MESVKKILGLLHTVDSEEGRSGVYLDEEEYQETEKERRRLSQSLHNAKVALSIANDSIDELRQQLRAEQESRDAAIANAVEEARLALVKANESELAELEDLRDYVQRLKKANADLSNKAKGLPKEEHSGYIVVGFNNLSKVTVFDQKKPTMAECYETVVQTPFPWSYGIDGFRTDCFSKFLDLTDRKGVKLIDKLGLSYIGPSHMATKGYKLKNMSSSNYILDHSFRGGRNGYWEIVILHPNFIPTVPEDMMRLSPKKK